MTRNSRIGVTIVLVAAIGSAIGLLAGYLSITTAVGIAVIGIVIGTGTGTAVARGRFSHAADATKRN